MTSIKQLLEENIGYGMSMKDMLSVQMASFPNTQADPISPIATTGETTELNEPRNDTQIQNQLKGNEDQEIIGEIASLLISIGYVLQSKGIIQDKFNKNDVIQYLSQTFSNENITDAPTENNVDNIQNQNTIQNFGIKVLQERKLFESKLFQK